MYNEWLIYIIEFYKKFLGDEDMQNMFCKSTDLTNEAAVEANFMIPFIWKMKYESKDVSFKESISEIPIGKGGKKILYKPDFVLKITGIPTVVIDAKAPSEDLNEWTLQCSSYCLELNKYYDYNPVQFYILSNGLKLQLYQWDKRSCILELDFKDFDGNNEKYKKLVEIIEKNNIILTTDKLKKAIDEEYFEYKSTNLQELSKIFADLHKMIWRSEKKSPSAAFLELIKIVFIKIDQDKKIHHKYGKSPLPKYKDIIFSTHWIMGETENNNPINDPLFKNLVRNLEKEILYKRKKRIFDQDESINLSSETVLKIVKTVEHFDFYAMEEDVNGRLFESFLDATARGKDIGQFFTPREIVSLMVDLADIKVTKNYVPKVLDACCGSGGFLITSMAKMLNEVSKLSGLTNRECSELEKQIKEESIYGIDAGSEPAMYRIARMNMYLHGDGGSKIYYADSLDKGFGKVGPSSLENDSQLNELRTKLVDGNMKFDIILSNPPFSLQYSREDSEQAEILNQYEMAVNRTEGKICNKLLSSVMFIERYKDLVSENGTILAIIDDSVLSGDSYSHVRNYLRNNFIIKAVISLPGDAFKRSTARVKTSILILKLKIDDESQADIFMYSVKYIGLEKKIAKRIGVPTEKLDELKRQERDKLVDDYRNFLDGKKGKYSIVAENIQERLDVKYCINDRGRKKDVWVKNGYLITSLGKELKVQNNRSVQVDEDVKYQLLRVTYEGDIVEGDVLLGDESSYSKLFLVKEWDILISNMGVGRGAVGIVPPYHANKYVSNEYTILRANNYESTVFYTNLLRTKEILADILSTTTGMNRGRIKWDIISNVAVPMCDSNDKNLQALTKEMVEYWDATQKYMTNRIVHSQELVDIYDVDGEEACERWLGFKPPE